MRLMNNDKRRFSTSYTHYIILMEDTLCGREIGMEGDRRHIGGRQSHRAMILLKDIPFDSFNSFRFADWNFEFINFVL